MRTVKLITPEIAAELITKGRKDNVMSRTKIDRYKDMMLSGKWRDGLGSSILLKKGVLLNGRHRLTAIVETGLSIKIPYDDFT